MSDPRLSLREVLDRLRAEGLVAAEPAALRVLPVQPPPMQPWYVRLFAGMGAWVAALLVLVFLGISEIFEAEGFAMVVGLVICAGAAAMSRVRERGDFLSQLALSFSLLGQGLFTVALAILTDDPAPTALGVIVLEIILIVAYDDQFHRFLCGLAIVAALLILVVESKQPDLIHPLVIGLAALALAASANEHAILASRWWEIVHPLRYSAVVGMLGLLVLPLVDDFEVAWWGFSALGVGAVLGLAIWLIARDATKDWRSGWLLLIGGLAAGALILGLKMPGLVAALLALVLGFWRGNRSLMGLAAAFVIFYLGAYYYALQLTLLAKSLLMIVTGCLLLALRWAAAQFGRQGEVP